MENVLTSLSNDIADVVSRTGAAVVQVRSRGSRPSTGVVCARERVLTVDTNADDEAELAVVHPKDGRVPAVHAGRDPSTGLALLRTPGLDIEPAVAAGEPARLGSLVIALGRGMSGTLVSAAGIVSSVGGPLRGGVGAFYGLAGRGPAIEQVLRTDITPYPGFAGGALIDPVGHVVGIGTGIELRGLSLVIPASVAWQVADKLGTHGRIRRGYLGIVSQPVRLPEHQRGGRPADHGLLVVGIGSNSPAMQAGLFVGDVIVDFDGQTVGDPDDLLALLAGDRVGQQVPIGVLRAGAYQAVPVTIGERQGTR